MTKPNPTLTRLAETIELAQNATPGTWYPLEKAHFFRRLWHVCVGREGSNIPAKEFSQGLADSKYIAHCNPTYVKALAEALTLALKSMDGCKLHWNDLQAIQRKLGEGM